MVSRDFSRLSHFWSPHVLKPDADPVVPFLLSSAIEQEILLNHDHQIAQHECVVLRPLPDIIMDVLLGLMTRAMPFFPYVRA